MLTQAKVTYTKARAGFAQLCDQVTADRDIVIITRRNAENVALIPESELSSLIETAHLLRSPKNAERLLSALNRAKLETVEPQSVDEIRREFGLAKKTK